MPQETITTMRKHTLTFFLVVSSCLWSPAGTGFGVCPDANGVCDPSPRDGAEDVSRDVILTWSLGGSGQRLDLFLGTSWEDVNNATVDDPGNVLVYADLLNSNCFDPGRLVLGQQYYWRVDVQNSEPDVTVLKGEVWQFMTEPFSYPVIPMTAKASSSFRTFYGPENTINGSGLVDDLHGVDARDMWHSAEIPASIEYAFDRAYKLHELWIWNWNTSADIEIGGDMGAKDVIIEYSLDGEDWAVLEGVGPLAQAFLGAPFDHENTIDFGGAMARWVRLTINSVHGFFAPIAGLSEVRFFSIPVRPREPEITMGASLDRIHVDLHWRPGREAAEHLVYLSSDRESVANNGALLASTRDAHLNLEDQALKYATEYFWKVIEVNEMEMPSQHAGDIWNFWSPDFGIVDDFNVYVEPTYLAIFQIWIDGFDDPNNGSQVCLGGAYEVETEHVYEGAASLPLLYDNRSAPKSQTTFYFHGFVQDWTRGDPNTLSLLFCGDSLTNDAEPLYLIVEDSSGRQQIVYHPDPLAALSPHWQEWRVSLADFSTLNLAAVKSMSLGLGQPQGKPSGRTGLMLFDTIRIGRPYPNDANPGEPNKRIRFDRACSW